MSGNAHSIFHYPNLSKVPFYTRGISVSTISVYVLKRTYRFTSTESEEVCKHHAASSATRHNYAHANFALALGDLVREHVGKVMNIDDNPELMFFPGENGSTLWRGWCHFIKEIRSEHQNFSTCYIVSIYDPV